AQGGRRDASAVCHLLEGEPWLLGGSAVVAAGGVITSRSHHTIVAWTRREARYWRTRSFGGGTPWRARSRHPRALRPAASAVGARLVSGGTSRSVPRVPGARPRSGLLPGLLALGLLAATAPVNGSAGEMASLKPPNE